MGGSPVGWRRCRAPDEPGPRSPAPDGRPPRAPRPAARARGRGRRAGSDRGAARAGPRAWLPGAAEGDRPPGPARRRHRLLEDVVASGDARGRDHARGRRPRRLRTRPAAGSPRARRTRDGLLPRQQRGGRGAVRPGGARARASRHRRLRRPPRQRHRGTVPRRRHRLLRLAPSMAVLAGIRWPGHERRVDAEHPAAGAVGRRRLPERVRDVGRAGGASVPARPRPRLGRLRRAPATRWRRWKYRQTDSGSLPSVAPHSARASPPCSRAATTSRRCRPSLPRPTAASGAAEKRERPASADRSLSFAAAALLEGKRALPASARTHRGSTPIVRESHPPA